MIFHSGMTDVNRKHVFENSEKSLLSVKSIGIEYCGCLMLCVLSSEVTIDVGFFSC
jgi:hypothetical protein